MSLIHFQPARATSWAAQLHRDLERAFDFNGWANAAAEQGEQANWAPPVDIRETDKSFVIAVDVPGVAQKDIEITADKGVLTIRGTRASEPEEPNRYRRVERAYGKFARGFTLPETARTDAIEAKTSNGVLTVTIPKQEAVQPRRIEVAAA